MYNIPKCCNWQAYVPGFDFEAVNFKQAVNMFETINIARNIYEGIVHPYYKKLLGKKPPMLVIVVILEEETPYQIEIHIWVDSL